MEEFQLCLQVLVASIVCQFEFVFADAQDSGGGGFALESFFVGLFDTFLLLLNTASYQHRDRHKVSLRAF